MACNEERQRQVLFTKAQGTVVDNQSLQLLLHLNGLYKWFNLCGIIFSFEKGHFSGFLANCLGCHQNFEGQKM